MTSANIWDEILSRVETKVNRHVFYTWFKPTTLVTDAHATITVRVPGTHFKEWLPKHYSAVLAEALDDVHRGGARLVFVPDAHTAAVDDAPASLVEESPMTLTEPAPQG